MRSDQSLPSVAFRALAVIVLAVACGLMAAPRARGAAITWGSATGVTADSNVSTTGTLINAINVGDTGTPATTINGVNFQPLIIASGSPAGTSATVGNATLTTALASVQANASGPLPLAPGGVSSNYKQMLSSFVAIPFGNMSLQFSSLTVGAQYQFQWWANDGGGNANAIVDAIAGNTVALQSNPTSTSGAVGQFAIGTFTADATMETITFAPDAASNFPFSLLSGFELRQLTTGPTGGGGGGTGVPLPPAVWTALGLAAVAALSARRWARGPAAGAA
jgi:hypothetical protein